MVQYFETMLPYTLVRSKRNKTVRLHITSAGTIKITAPLKAPRALIEAFIARKSSWIKSVQEKLKTRVVLPKPKTYNEFLHLKKQTLALVKEAIAHYNTHNTFTYKKISIKTGTSRWGSCSARKNLNFHYCLALLPAPLAHYIVVHELCHLIHLNHSAAFWSLVSQTIPNYKIKRAQLAHYIIPQ